jgi:putative PEP-CTERM system integral membrane protein
MEYRALTRGGAWPLPRLAERRNVYWSRRTERALAGAASPGDAWLPESVPAKSAAAPARHVVSLPGGAVVIASPVNPDSLRIQPVRLAVVVDTSRSMGAHAKAVASELAWIQEALRGQSVHLFVAAAPSSGRGPEKLEEPSAFRPGDVVWYGNLEWGDLLAQFEKLRGDTQYDAVAVVTDEGAYESATAKPDPAKPFPVLWMIHTDGTFPQAYADPILDLLSRPGSGSAATLADAMRRYSSGAALPNATTDIADGYQWTLETTSTAAAAPEDPFAPFGARQLVLAMGRGLAGRGLSGLDDVHDVAVKHHIVTPYSSMLVLVNDEQRKRLDELSAQDDRFEREAPQEVAVAQGADLLEVSGVPEPREWALLAVAAALLLAIARKQRLSREG